MRYKHIITHRIIRQATAQPHCHEHSQQHIQTAAILSLTEDSNIFTALQPIFQGWQGPWSLVNSHTVLFASKTVEMQTKATVLVVWHCSSPVI